MVRMERYYRIQIISGDILSLISQLTLSGVELQNIDHIDLLTVTASIKSSSYKRVCKMAVKSGASCKIMHKEGMLWVAEKIVSRPVLLFGLLIFLCATVTIPNRIFFVDVQGNNEISDKCILTHAESMGMKFGASTSDLRSEELKNKLLASIPQLQWVGITTKGCVAQIHVMERSTVEVEEERKKTVTSIVSACDGVITDQIVYEGNPMFQIGDAVQEGDVLVSGYVDCGIKLRAGQADAEIYALTMRQKQFISPKALVKRGGVQQIKTCYKLRIGKKVINFCNHSGIMDTGCVKMYLEDYWTLPGGFYLPVSVIRITHSSYETTQTFTDETASRWLPQFAQKYLRLQMVSGAINREELIWDENEKISVLTGIYACREMIGREKYEGIIE